MVAGEPAIKYLKENNLKKRKEYLRKIIFEIIKSDEIIQKPWEIKYTLMIIITIEACDLSGDINYRQFRKWWKIL